MKANSYSSVGTFPTKLLKSNEAVVRGRIAPVHVQLTPTNRCNGNCPWCSCSKVDRTRELPAEETFCLLEYFTGLGTKAWTITGGGEPTIHPAFSEIIYHINRLGGQVGLATNGLCWSAGRSAALEQLSHMITWARYSVINEEPERIRTFCANLPATDVGISMVIPKDANVGLAKTICQFADSIPNLTHIRFVQEILNLDNESMARVEEECKGITPKAFFQWRKEYTHGRKRCLMSLLKPLIDARGYIYPCCGVQYASEEPSRGMGEEFNMGHWSKFHLLSAFDGSICAKCYYDEYNDLLERLVEPVHHERFI